jgi:hypothetical protein
MSTPEDKTIDTGRYSAMTDIPQTLDGICVILGVGRISSWEENLWNKPTAVKP